MIDEQLRRIRVRRLGSEHNGIHWTQTTGSSRT